MQATIYNTAKQRLETVNIEITEENSTWFDDNVDANAVLRITDFQNGLLIKQCNYDYPIWFYDVSRADIDHCPHKAQNLLAM